MISGCASTTSTTPATPTVTTIYLSQTNLVSDTSVFAPAHMDPALINAWGIAFSSGGKPWLSSNHGSVSTVYDTAGVLQSISPVNIPVPGAVSGGAPSGIVFNPTPADFNAAKFIFSTEDGTIAAWSSGAAATIVSDQSSNSAEYKGLAIVSSSHKIYATDFHNNMVDVFDNSFTKVSSFTDNTIPTGYGAFGIQNINDTLYVTFARQKYDKGDDSSGLGIGFVDRFTAAGALIGRFASNGNLNSPWGIALAPASWGQFANAILIGNFGDGAITAYSQSGTMIGQLMSSSTSTIHIPGLWAISFNPVTGTDQSKLYFTAGPYDEDHGLFGYLK